MPNHHRRTRLYLTLFILGLNLYGLTAFPQQHELDLLARHHPTRLAPTP
jgi:hypothetical protein